MQVIDAVGASKLPADLKLLLFALAYLAESSTGRGFTGQARLAKFISCSDRAVRLKLERLQAIADSPVRIVRRPRARHDGRGRTSDEYQLVLNAQASTGSPLPVKGDRPTGNSLPVEQPGQGSDQPEAQSGPTGSSASDQPEAGFQGSSQVILVEDPRSIVARKLTTPKRGSESKGESKSKKAERTAEQKQAHKEVTAWYFVEFKRIRGVDPTWTGAEAKLVYTLLDRLKFDCAMARQRVTNGLESFPGTVTIREIARNPDKYAVAPPAQRGGPRPVQGGDISGVLARARGKVQNNHGQTGFEAVTRAK